MSYDSFLASELDKHLENTYGDEDERELEFYTKLRDTFLYEIEQKWIGEGDTREKSKLSDYDSDLAEYCYNELVNFCHKKQIKFPYSLRQMEHPKYRSYIHIDLDLSFRQMLSAKNSWEDLDPEDISY